MFQLTFPAYGTLRTTLQPSTIKPNQKGWEASEGSRLRVLEFRVQDLGMRSMGFRIERKGI